MTLDDVKALANQGTVYSALKAYRGLEFTLRLPPLAESVELRESVELSGSENLLKRLPQASNRAVQLCADVDERTAQLLLVWDAEARGTLAVRCLKLCGLSVASTLAAKLQQAEDDAMDSPSKEEGSKEIKKQIFT